MEPSESYEVAHYVPAASLPYSQPGSCYTLVRLPGDDPTAGRNAGPWKLRGQSKWRILISRCQVCAVSSRYLQESSAKYIGKGQEIYIEDLYFSSSG